MALLPRVPQMWQGVLASALWCTSADWRNHAKARDSKDLVEKYMVELVGEKRREATNYRV